MRTFGVAPDVSVPMFPLYSIPHHLGQSASSAVSATGPVAGSTVTSILASSPTWGAAAGPIGAAVAAGIAIVAALLAKHEQRLKDAKTENARVGAAIPSFYETIQGIVSALNAGQLAATDAITGLEQLDASTLQLLREFIGTPGTAWQSSTPGVCDKTCTVGCCVYNTWLHPDLFGASGKQGVIPVIQAGGGTVGIGGIPTNKYGFPSFPHQTVTINPPSPGASVAGAVMSLESAMGGGSGGLLFLGALAVGAFLLLR